MANRWSNNDNFGNYPNGGGNGQRYNDAYHQTWKTTIAKSSGKVAPYILFMREQGFRLYRSKYGVPFDFKNDLASDRAGEFWKGLDPVEKQAYHDRAALMNANPEENRKRRERANEHKRRERHENAMTHFLEKQNHKINLRKNQQRQYASRGPLYLPPKQTLWTELPITEQSIKAKRKDDLKHIINVLKFRSIGLESGNPLIEDVMTFQMISVFPITFIYRAKHRKVFTYPAEISITTFDLKYGTSPASTKSIMVEFDQEAFFGKDWNANNPEYGPDRVTREVYARALGIPEDGPEGDVKKPAEAYQWIMDNVKCSFLLCDAQQYLWVARGIQILGEIRGLQAQRHFSDEIENRLYCVQDFLSAVMQIFPSTSKLEKWTFEEIENVFKNDCLEPIEELGTFCNFHRNLPVPIRKCKYNCCVAHNARLIHLLFTSLREYDLRGYSVCYKIATHVLCEDKNKAVAEIPSAPSIKDIENSNNTSTELDQEFLARNPMKRLHPLMANSDKNDYKICIEALMLESDSDDDYEDDDDDVTNANAQAGGGFGFPFVNFIDNSARQQIVYSAGDNHELNNPEPGIQSTSQNVQSTSEPRMSTPRPLEDLGMTDRKFLYKPFYGRPRATIKICSAAYSDRAHISNELNAFFDGQEQGHHPAVTTIY